MRKYAGYIFLLLAVAAFSSCGGKDIGPAPESKTTRIIRDSPTAAEFSAAIFNEKLYAGKAESKGGEIWVYANELNAAYIKQLYGDYCAAKGGKLAGRYVPPGYSKTLSAGFANQNVFFHDSKIGRTEFEFCRINDSPSFAITNIAPYTFYIIEGKALTAYANHRKGLVERFAGEAKKINAFYAAESEGLMDGFTVRKLILRLYADKPQISAEFINKTNEKLQVALDSPVGLLVDTERYLMSPAYAGGDALNVAANGDGCVLNKARTTLTLPPAGICSVAIAYNAEREMKGLPQYKATLFFVGIAQAVLPNSELDTSDSRIWLKPRLDKYR